jgi:signal transduction histidine kinase
MISSGFAAYYLILILLSAAALIKAFLLWKNGKFPQGSRMVFGLSILTIIRVVILLMSVFMWQGESGFSPRFDLFNISFDFICFLIIFWIWNFPEPSRIVDTVGAAVSGVAAAVVVLTALVFPQLLNSFLASRLLWQLLIFGLLAVSLTLILIRKPNQWESGLLMGGILAAGTVLNWIFPPTSETFVDVLQLTQLAAYPLLMILVDRFQLDQHQPLPGPAQSEEEDIRRRTAVDFNLMNLIQELFSKQPSGDLLYQIARSASELMLSDLTMLFDTPDNHGKVRIIAGYDLIREEKLQAFTLEARSIPLLSNYIENGKVLHLPASSTSRDLSHLSHTLQLTAPGHLLAAPIQIPNGNKRIGLVLFSPFSNRPWSQSDQDYALLLTKFYSAAFRHHFALEHEEPDEVKKTIRELSSKLTQLTQEKQKLQKDLADVAREFEQIRWKNEEQHQTIEGLREEQGALLTHIKMLSNLAERESLEAYRKYLSMVEKELKIKRDKQKTAEDSQGPDQAPPADEPEADLKHANLTAVLETVTQELSQILEDKQIKHSTTLPDDIPHLRMTFGLFREILTILLTNAVDETEAGGEISVLTQIFDEDENQRFAHLKISDQGQGYYPHELAAVLNNPLSAEEQEKLTRQMTNLYVSKNLVENEGGRLWVESEPGEGTTVSLLLPLEM